MHKLLIGLMLSTGLFSVQSAAFDFGKALEDAAKQKIEEVKNGGESKSESSTPEADALKSNTSQTTPTEQAPEAKAFNWKNPSKQEEIALGREITGSLLGAAPLVKDEALQKYVNKVGRVVANQSERSDLPWKFGVIESSDLNAFAAPGGYVLITKGP